MRRLLNILAVIIGVISGLAGLFCAGTAVFMITSLLGTKASTLLEAPAILGIALFAGVSFLGFLIASRALRHLKHPDAGTVRDMIGTAIYLIVLAGVLPLGTKLHAPGSLLLALIVGLYLFHRTLVKRINARAFPPDAAAPTSISTT